MSENTGIRIETVREITGNGKVGFRVLSVAALPESKLPAMYLDNDKKPIVCLDSTGELSLNEGTYWVCPGSFYTTIEIEKRLAHIREAGQHLTDVNAHLRKEREAWHGKVTFIDGVATEDETVPSKNPEEISIPLAKRIAELWGEGRLLYRNARGHIKPLKPSA